LRPSLSIFRQLWSGLILSSLVLMASGCGVRHTTHVPVAQVPPPAKEATLPELVDRINRQSAAIQTLNATVDLAPAAGSVYSGVIKEYRDVKGFILVERPQMIRIIGQAPVVRTNIFDMVSNGREFELYLPTKQKFIVGKTTFLRPSKNALESLRPQHILDALLVPAVDSAHEQCFLKEDEDGTHRYYVVGVVESQTTGSTALMLERELWFDRSTLDLVRLRLYGPNGSYIEDVHYADYRDFQGVRYPGTVQITRPVEDYSLSITIEKAVFNQPIAPEKFVLKKPEGAQLVELSRAARPPEPGAGDPRGALYGQ
jgi:outer membrane lipoprotein-sorting protein